MEFDGIVTAEILSLGISQIYLNKRKTDAIMKWMVPKSSYEYEPLQVHDFGNGRYTLTDGHSRAYVAYKMGYTHLPIVYDRDEIITNEVGRLLYAADIEWCNRFHLENILDLEKRIVDDKTYNTLWVERCERSYNLLTITTKQQREFLKEKAPELFLYGSSADLSVLYFENGNGKLYKFTDGLLEAEEI